MESGTDVRMVEGLAERFELSIVARGIENGVTVSHPPRVEVPTIVSGGSRSGFARFVRSHLVSHAASIDFVLVQGYGLAALAANVAGRRTGVPTAMLVCSPVEAYYECRRANPQAGKPFRRWELEGQRIVARLNARVGTRYIVLSEHLADVVRGHGWSGPVDVVPIYGVDTERFRPSGVPRDALRRELGLPESGAILFFSSRVAPEKDSEAVLRATRQLLDGGRDIWLLHRSGGFEEFLRDAERFGVRDRVLAADAVHPHRELALMYQASDLCVQASRAEGLGFSPLEALACGVPVIATRVGGLRETIRDGETGWQYPVGDAAALAGCIEAALDDPAEAARRAENGREMVVREYDSRTVFSQLGELVKSRVQ